MIGKAESKYTVINHLRLHYLDWGEESARPMVLLHGSGDNAHVWDYFSSYVSKYFRIIALDQRGHGDSDWPIPPAYKLNDYVSDFIQLVETLHARGIVLMGHSIGALHATAYAAMKPEKVSALIHIDIEPCPPSWNKKYLHRLYDTLPTRYDSIQDFVDQIHETSPFASKEMLFYLASFALSKKRDGKFYARFDREVLSHFDQYDLRPHLSSVRCPTLIVRGKESRVTRKEVALEMSQIVANGKFVEIPSATHPVHMDNPTKFREAVLEFLNDCGFISGERIF